MTVMFRRQDEEDEALLEDLRNAYCAGKVTAGEYARRRDEIRKRMNRRFWIETIIMFTPQALALTALLFSLLSLLK